MSLFGLLSRCSNTPTSRRASTATSARPRPATPSPRFSPKSRAIPLDELQRDYVATFDFDRRTNLYLTYHLYGDRRRRGVELVRLKRRFREAQLELVDGELPTTYPSCSSSPSSAPERWTRPRRAARPDRARPLTLRSAGARTAHLLERRSSLPKLTRRQAESIRRLAAEGPPTEFVGLDSFTPPELEPFLREPARS